MIDHNYKYYPMLKIRVDFKNSVGANLTLFSYRMYRAYTLYYYKYPLLV